MYTLCWDSPPSALFSNLLFFDGDSIGVFYPDNLILGAPQWTSGILLGFPIPASFQWGYFHPLYQALSGHYNLLVLTFALLTGLFSYLFAHHLFQRRSVSAVTALLFTFGQVHVHWLGNIAVLSAAIALPVVMLGVRALVEKRWSRATMYAILCGATFLGAHQQFVVMALGVGALYWVWLEWGRGFGSILRDGLRALGIFGASILIGLPQFFYTAVFTPLSTRIGGLSYAQASVDAATPLDLIKFIFPNFSFRYGISAEFLPYIGFFGLLFTGIAIVKLYRIDTSVRFYTNLSVGVLLATFKYSPVFWILHQLPVFSYFRGPARWTYVLTFTMAVLAGYGMKWALEHRSEFRAHALSFSRWLMIGIGTLGVLSSAVYKIFGTEIIAYLQRLFDERMYASTTGLPLAYYHTLIRRIVETSFANFSISSPAFLIALGSAVAMYFVVRYAKTSRTFSIAVIGVTAASLLLSGLQGRSFASGDIITTSPPLAEYIRSHEASSYAFRTFSFLAGTAGSQKISAIHEGASSDALLYGIDALMPNTGLFWDIPTIDGYEPMAPRRGQRVLAFVGSEVSQRFASLANEGISLTEKLSLFSRRLPILSMLNVKYLISAYELPPAPGLSLLKEESSTRFNIPIYLYENKSVLPRIYFANNIVFVSETDEEKNFKTIIESNGDFAKRTFLECATCHTLPHRPSPSDALAIQEYRDGYVRLTTSTAHDRWLVFSESNLPGWRITIDGIPTQSYMANYLFHAFHVPAGVHEAVFEYTGVLTGEYLRSLF